MHEKAKAALDHQDWDNFFDAINCDSKEGHQVLFQEALRLAKLQENVEAIKRLIDYPIASESFVASAFNILIEINIEVAISTAVLCQEAYKVIAWHAIGQYWLHQKDFGNLYKILSYLPNGEKIKSLLLECVKNFSSESDDLIWFLAFLRASCLAHKKIEYYQQQKFEKAMPRIIEYQPFSEIKNFFEQWPDSSSKAYFIEKLYLALFIAAKMDCCQALHHLLPDHLRWLSALPSEVYSYARALLLSRKPTWGSIMQDQLVQDNFIEILYINLLIAGEIDCYQALNTILPDSLRWLATLALALENENYFYLLNNITHGDKELLADKVTANFLQRYSHLSDDHLAEKIFSMVIVRELKAPAMSAQVIVEVTYDDLIGFSAWNNCMSQGRIAVVVKLLIQFFAVADFEDFFSFRIHELFLALLDKPLSFEQLEQVLQLLETQSSRISSLDEILAKLLLVPLTLNQYERIFLLLIALKERDHYISDQSFAKLLQHDFLDQHHFCTILQNMSDHELQRYRNNWQSSMPPSEKLSRDLIEQLLAQEVQRRETIKKTEEIERERKKQEELEMLEGRMHQKFTQLQKFSTVPKNKKNQRYDDLCAAMNYFRKIKELDKVLELCKKMVKSKYRDELARSLITEALESGEYHIAQKCPALFIKQENKDRLLHIIQLFAAKSYKKLFKTLVQLNTAANFVAELLICVRYMLQDQKQETIGFLIREGIFSVRGILGSHLTVILEKIFSEKPLIELMRTTLEDTKNDCESLYLIIVSRFLKQNQLPLAIQFANIFFSYRKYFWDAREHPIEQAFYDYFCNVALTSDTLALIGPLDHNFQATLLLNLWPQTFEEFNEQNFSLILLVQALHFREQKLMQFFLHYLKSDQFAKAEKVTVYFDEEKKQVLLWVINQFKLHEYAALFTLITREKNDCSELFSLALERWLVGKTANELFPIVREFYQVSQKNIPGNYSSYSGFYKVFPQWSNLLLNDKNYLNLFEGLAVLFACSINEKIDRLLMICLSKTVDGLIQQEKFSVIFTALDLLLKHRQSICYEDEMGNSLRLPQPHEQINTLFVLLLKKHRPDLASQLLRNQAFFHYHPEEQLLQLADYYFQQENYLETEATWLQIKNLSFLSHSSCAYSYKQSEKLQDWVMRLISQKKWQFAEPWIKKYFPAFKEEWVYKKTIYHLIDCEYLCVAQHYLQQYISSPSDKFEMRQKLERQYCQSIGRWVGEETLNDLHALQKKSLQGLDFLENGSPEALKEARMLQNTILLELRNLLDKAFLRFYRNHYGDPPRIAPNNIVNVYFPVVPNILPGTTVEKRLCDYFKTRIRQPTFSQQHPDVFAHLLEIQPLSNPDYLWLQQLYALANQQKHDASLVLNPEINGQKIDIATYLPQAIDGVVELLLRLFQPTLTADKRAALQFSKFLLPPSRPIQSKVRGTLFHHAAAASTAIGQPPVVRLSI